MIYHYYAKGSCGGVDYCADGFITVPNLVAADLGDPKTGAALRRHIGEDIGAPPGTLVIIMSLTLVYDK